MAVDDVFGTYCDFDCSHVGLYRIHALDGGLVYDRITSGTGPGYARVAVARGMTYVDDSGTLWALSGTDDTALWHRNGGSARPSLANGVVYSECPAGMCARMASDGSFVWANAGASGTPGVANGMVFTACSGGVCGLNAATGATMWSSPSTSSDDVIVANGVVYQGASDGSVRAFDAATGSLLRTFVVGTQQTNPIVVNGQLIVVVGQNILAYAP